MKRLVPLTVALGAALATCPAAAPAASLHFVDVAPQAGVTAVTWCGREEKPHILESGGTGLALFDYDGDGDLDLYVENGWRLSGAEVVERGRNVLYRNRGDGTFDDVTERAGVGDDGWGTGLAVGDADGDGEPDLLVTNFGPDVLYRNNGDGTFGRVAGAPSIDGWSTGAVFFDADGDGDEDLFVGAYIDCTLEEVLNAEPQLDWEGMKVMKGPFGLEGLANRYFENVGGGRFEEATERAGLTDVGLFYTFSVAALDLDGDLDLDLYAANDSNPNYLYQNDGKGRFQEVGLWSGAALDEGGNAQAGMGLAAADVDADGDVDLFVTNFYRDVSTLYRNLGDFIFEDVTRPFGLDSASYMPLSWGAVFGDLDLDGDLDLYVANGHIYPQADLATEVPTSFRQRNLLLAGDGDRFVDVTAAAGPGLESVEVSHGLVAGDLDADGDLDLAVSNVDARPNLLRNDSRTDGGWLVVDAPGALAATVEAGGRRWTRHRLIGGSFVSVSDPRFHFGLGAAGTVDRLTLLCPDGRESVFGGLATNRVLVSSHCRMAGMNASDNARNDTWSVTYGDHSGNTYRFWKDPGDGARFTYDPVTPERSSSGTYSGGRPNEGTLDPARIEALFEWIRDLEADTGSHADSRRMGTGSFRVSEGGGAERRFILRSGPRRQAFDAFVEPFRKP